MTSENVGIIVAYAATAAKAGPVRSWRGRPAIEPSAIL